jgi:DNA transformation protein and related proteins
MSAFTAHLHDVFRTFGAVELRRMFGGHGVYHQGLMFALVVDDTLYLKADALNRGFFEREQLPRFTYRRSGRTASIGYHRAPDTMLEDAAAARAWARRSFEAALRAQAARRKTPARRRTPS